MARPKKDGRHINYYIDRLIYERFEEYADEKGQTMTTALERILKQFFDKVDDGKEQSEIYLGGGSGGCCKGRRLHRYL